MGTISQSEDVFCQLWNYVNVSTVCPRGFAMCACVCVCVCVHMCTICFGMHTRTADPSGSFSTFCSLRCSDDTFLSRPQAHCGSLGVAEERRRGGQRGADAFLSGDKEPLRHPLFSSPRRSPPAFIGRASKWRSAYEKGPVFMPRKLAYRRPSPTHFTKTPSHLCHVREGRPSSAGSPPFFFSAPSSPLSPLAVPFSPLNYCCEGRRRRRRRRGGRGRIGHSQIKRKRVKKVLGKGRDRQAESAGEKVRKDTESRSREEERKKERKP